MPLRSVDEVLQQRGHWIDGRVSPSAGEEIAVENPASEEILGHVVAGDAADVDRAVVELARGCSFTGTAGSATLFYEPVGVAGCITPWNLPLNLVAQKLGAALVTGCTTVFKPSELTPFSTLRLADCMAEAGCPPGVFNVVTGTGRPPAGPWSATPSSGRCPSPDRPGPAGASARWPPTA